jgi:plasmid stabilization system protein ParE
LNYRFEITARALADADDAYTWIAHRSPDAAERWYQGLFERIETLTRQPRRCPLAAENAKHPEEIREILYGKRGNKYRILFTIRDDTVVVLYIHHGARNELDF